MLEHDGVRAMMMPTRKAGEPTAYYIGASAMHHEAMDVIFTGRVSNDGVLYLYNLRMDNPQDTMFEDLLEFVADVQALMDTENWLGDDNE
jgi:hypothetical protein